MRSGRLRHRVAIQGFTDSVISRGSHGGVSGSWITSTTRYMWIKPLSGTENREGGKVDARLTHEFGMRYDPNLSLSPANRLRWSSRNFDVVEVYNVNEAQKETRFRCVEDVT